MKHATSIALDALEPLLDELRAVEWLTERKRGVFYRRSRAMLHFHEDPSGFFADLRLEPGWVRLPVNTAPERRHLVKELREAVATPSA
jgi:hypothetical protein